MSVQDFMEDLTRRVEQKLGRKLESRRELGREIGVDSSQVRLWEEMGSKPKPATVAKVAGKLKLSTAVYNQWMAFIEDMPSPPEIVSLPYYEGGVNAGIGGRLPVDTIVDHVAVEKGLLRQYGAVGDVIVFRLLPEADSMEPVIPRGAMVFVDTGRGKDRLAFQNGSAYAVAVDQDTREIAIKWVQRRGQELWLVSANEEYPAVKAWTNNLAFLIVGLVIFYQGVPARKTNGFE